MIRYTALLEKDYRFYYSETFGYLYQALVNNRDTKVFEDMSTMFTFMASIGIKRNLKLEYKEKNSSNQIRLQTLKDKHLNIIYAMMFEIKVMHQDLSILTEPDFFNTSLKEIELYAEGGMNFVYQTYLKPYINGSTLLSSEMSFNYLFTKITLDQVMQTNDIDNQLEKVKIELSTKNKLKIINHKPVIYLKQIELCRDNVVPLTAKIYFMDLQYMPVSNEKEIIFDAFDTISDIRLELEIHQKIQLPSQIYLVIEDKETSNIEAKYVYDVQINFKSDLL